MSFLKDICKTEIIVEMGCDPLFTGIIQEVGTMEQKVERGDDFQLTIKADEITTELTQGESVAVNGTCLTVVEFSSSQFTADVMPETVKNTNLRLLKKGSPVNLELPVKPDSFFGGHMVTGHIDGRGLVSDIDREGNARVVTIEIPEELNKYLVAKGSVAVNGVSLTIASLGENVFRISLIPETWQQTNLKYLKPGVEVNVETDLIGKYVVKMMENQKQDSDDSGMDRDFLRENGFL